MSAPRRHWAPRSRVDSKREQFVTAWGGALHGSSGYNSSRRRIVGGDSEYERQLAKACSKFLAVSGLGVTGRKLMPSSVLCPVSSGTLTKFPVGISWLG